MTQALENIPPGDINVTGDAKVHLPDKSEVYGSIEGVIHQFESVMDNRGYTMPVAEVYSAQETPNGELGFYIVSDGAFRPWRVKTRGPSFVHLSSVARLLRGHTISEVVITLPGLNIIAAELDR